MDSRETDKGEGRVPAITLDVHAHLVPVDTSALERLDGVARRHGDGVMEVDGQPVRLTAQEYRLLAYLMHHPGRVVSRTELTEHLYDQDFDRDSNTIEVFVGRLRKKLGVDVIETARGLGYRVRPPDEA